MPTTAWIILSVISGIISWVVLYGLYIVLFAPFVMVENTILGNFGTTYPVLNTFVANITSGANAAFVIIGIGVFFFMMVAPFLFEPTSIGGDF
jgi:hypothetical protein